MFFLFDGNAAKNAIALDVDGVCAGVLCGFIGAAAKNVAAADLYINVFGHEDGNAAKNAVCVNSAIPFDNGIAQIELRATENNVELGRMKHLFIIAYAVRRKNGVCRVDITIKLVIVTVIIVVIIIIVIIHISSLFAKQTSKQQLQSHSYYKNGQKQLPKYGIIQNVACAQKQKYTKQNAAKIADNVTVGKEIDRARNNDKERPPTPKKDIDVGDLKRVERKNDTCRNQK